MAVVIPTSLPEGMSPGIPSGAVPAAICLLIYSFFCLSCGVLLVTTLVINKERWSYILLFAITTTLATTMSILQQGYFMAQWNASRLPVFEASLEAAKNPALALGPLSQGFGAVSYWVQIFWFNVNALLVLFWAVALTFNVWDWRIKGIYPHHHTIGVVSKVVAFVLPASTTILRASTKISIQFGPAFVLTSCLPVTLILLKYVRTRLGFSAYGSGSIEISDLPTIQGEGRSGSRSNRSHAKVRVDPWLVLRFTIAFVILSGFNFFLVFYSMSRYRRVLRSGVDPVIDFSVKAAVADVLNYIPGVTASLLAFLLFGTTSQSRATMGAIFGKGKWWGRNNRVSMPSFARGLDVRDEGPLREDVAPDAANASTKSRTHDSSPLSRQITHQTWRTAKRTSDNIFEMREYEIGRAVEYRPAVPEKDASPARKDSCFQGNASPR